MILSRPSLTASAACLPISVQLTYHCGFISGSTMSLERLLGYIHNEAGGKGSPEYDENIQHTNNLCSTYWTSLYLQTGTTMGLSLISLNWPLSLRACSTASLASKRFMPWEIQLKNLLIKPMLQAHHEEGWLLMSRWKCTHCRGKDDNETLYQEGGRHVNEQAILIQDVDEGQIVSLSNLVVIMVMSWGDFDSTWIENGADRQKRQREGKKKKREKP